MSLFSRAVEQRAMPWDSSVGWTDPAAIPPPDAFTRMTAGMAVTDQTALQVLIYLACLRLLSDTVSGLPLKQYKKLPVGSSKRKQLMEPAPLVADPFVGVEPQIGFFQTVMSLLMRGNAYLMVVARDYLGVPTMVKVLAPATVRVYREKGVKLYKVNNAEVDPADIIHIPWIILPGADVGINPIEYAAQDLGIALAAAEYGARFFSQGATPGGVLTTDKLLNKDQIVRIAKDMKREHGGIAQAHTPLILDAGLKWQQLTIPPEQAQFLLTRQAQRGEISSLLGVPPHLVGDAEKSVAGGKGVEETSLAFLTYAVRPIMMRIEAAFSRQLPRGQYVRFDAMEILRTNTLARWQAHAVGRSIGALNINDVRDLEDMDPIPGPEGNDYMAPLNSAQNGQGDANADPTSSSPQNGGTQV